MARPSCRYLFPLRTMKFVEQVASTRFPILIDGETGTGKSLLAGIIHWASPRAKAPCRTVGCGKLRPELAGSMLFGHEKGAFTGAITTVRGVFEEAAGGSIVLNDIDSLSFDIQAQLLDYFDDGHVTRIGSQKPIFPDVRVFVTTNKRPEALIAEGRLREDLYHRLNMFRHTCPALADRDDVADLAKVVLMNLYEGNFTDSFPSCPELTRDALEVISSYRSWPGNCRMLSAVLIRCLVRLNSSVIDGGMLREEIAQRATSETQYEAETLSERANTEKYKMKGSPQDERARIGETLRSTGGNVRRAAEMLKMSRSTLNSRIQKYEISLGELRSTHTGESV